MTRNYTKTGDQGETSIFYGERVSKHSLRAELFGTCEEANAMIGVAISHLPRDGKWDELHEMLHGIQSKLLDVGAELATPSGREVDCSIVEEAVQYLEGEIDNIEIALPPLTSRVLPGGSVSGSFFFMARTIVSRAERYTTDLYHAEGGNEFILKYLNRLSYFLFVAARYINQSISYPEVKLLKK